MLKQAQGSGLSSYLKTAPTQSTPVETQCNSTETAGGFNLRSIAGTTGGQCRVAESVWTTLLHRAGLLLLLLKLHLHLALQQQLLQLLLLREGHLLYLAPYLLLQ